MSRMILISVFVAALAACGASEPTPQSDDSVCAEAADVVSECTGDEIAAPTTCDGETRDAAQNVVDGGCTALADSKADGGFWCSWYARWMGRCTQEEGSENLQHIASLAEHAPASGTYVGFADAHGALAIDPAGEPCEVRLEADDDRFALEIDAFGITDAFILTDDADKFVTRFESDSDEFADGSGRQFHTMSINVETGTEGDLFGTSLQIVRFDNGNATVSITPDDTPTTSCTFRGVADSGE